VIGRWVSSPEERVSSSSQESMMGLGLVLGVEDAFLLFCGDSDNLLRELSNSLEVLDTSCFFIYGELAYLSGPWTLCWIIF
jgi:hypothetical protein